MATDWANSFHQRLHDRPWEELRADWAKQQEAAREFARQARQSEREARELRFELGEAERMAGEQLAATAAYRDLLVRTLGTAVVETTEQLSQDGMGIVKAFETAKAIHALDS